MEPEKGVETNRLKRYFQQIIDGEKVETEIAVLNNILAKNLSINFNVLNPKVKFVLPYMLVNFIKCWPGWKKISEYQNKQITFDDWYAKFKEYLNYKISYMMKNDFEKAIAMLRYNNSDSEDRLVVKKDTDTQTNHNVEKIMAPFTIELTGPPKILNALVFCEGAQDAVFVKEYKVSTCWGALLNVRQLINWPHIEIEFKSDHLHFKRTNNHDFKRCLTFSSEKIVFKKSGNFIDSINKIDENVERQAYTLNAITQYCNALITFLRTQENKKNIFESLNTLNETETTLEDFILDITDINMNSMATNTCVSFNIGNSIYARNKSIKADDPTVCFGECITPKMQLSLYTFTAIKEPTITSFDHLFTANVKHSLSITFKCTYCNVSYKNSTQLWNHLKSTHVMEQPVLCFKCKSQFKISDLTDNRWFHNCSSTTNIKE